MKIDKLNFELARLKRWKFGARTEAMTAAQRLLFAESMIEDEASLTTMGVITQAVMVQAAIDVNGMSQPQKVALADEIFAQQPNMLASILALPRMGAGMEELEVLLHILFVTFQAMKRSGHVWPIVSEDAQDRSMQRLTARARFNEGLPGDLANQIVQQVCDEHPERYLLAFVYGYLGDHDLLRVRTDVEKFLLLAALNLVECLAFAGPAPAS